jgi:flagellar motor switch protein FliM
MPAVEDKKEKGGALAAELGAVLGEAGAGGGEISGGPEGATIAPDKQADMAAQWATMINEDGPEEENAAGSGSERVLSQDEIDSLLGFNLDEVSINNLTGVRAIINSALVAYERLPMLEIVFDRLVRLLTTSLRNFTSDNVEVSFDGLKSVRFGEYLNSIPLPAILAVFKAEEWENFGLVTVDSNLIYSIIDVLLGGRRGEQTVRVEGRPYTTIETTLVRRLIEVVLTDAEQAFGPISPVAFNLERLETNPRFATISRPANAAIAVHLRIDMEDRGGTIEIVMPYATIEPIRDLLLQNFMGEKFGRDSIWEEHLATEIWAANVAIDSVLYEEQLPLRQLLDLKVGDTLMLDKSPEDSIILKVGDTIITEAHIGRAGDKVAVKIAKPFKRPKMTLAVFEKADESKRSDAA